MGLDEEQKAAVEARAGALCIVAPPGSGKTHTLVERIKHLVFAHGVAPERILALTFTNKAAREMRERLERRGLNALPYCATFHALAHDIVQVHGSALGIPADFTLVEDEKEKVAGALTFDELLSHALALLETHDDARKHWQNRFEHILVDEYQDADDWQDRIATILAESHGNIFVIGDPNQAIYGFRGANVGNFLTFGERYPAVRRIALNTNYRSTSTIVQAAHAIVDAETPRAFRPDMGEKIILAAFGSPREEAHWIVGQIEKLIGGMYHESGAEDSVYQPGDIAVLYRFNAIGKQLESVFAEAGIPHVLVTEANLDQIEFDTFRVPLMTMHAAKGLEFPVVFVAGIEDGVVPHLGFQNRQNQMQREALASTEPSRIQEYGEGGAEQATMRSADFDDSEERRLFYVAMTRAKDRLFLSHSAKRTLFGKTYTEPSRFLGDLPPEHLSIESRKPPKTYQKRLF